MEDADKETNSFLESLGVSDDIVPLGTGLTIENDTGEVIEATVVEEPDVTESVNADFTLARQNIVDITQVAKDAISKLAVIAEQSQHPRAFEVLFNGVKTVLDAQQDMLALHKKREELKPGSAANDGPVAGSGKNIQNNLFVGSTAELQKILSEINKQ